MSVAAWTVASGRACEVRRIRRLCDGSDRAGLGKRDVPGGLRTVTQTLKPAERGRGVAVGLLGRIARGHRHAADHYAVRVAMGMARGLDSPGLSAQAGSGLWCLSPERSATGRKPNRYGCRLHGGRTPPVELHLGLRIRGLPLGFVLRSANYLAQSRGTDAGVYRHGAVDTAAGVEIGYSSGVAGGSAKRSGTPPAVAARRLMGSACC